MGPREPEGHDEVVAGPFYYLGPDYTIARELYPPATINLAGRGPVTRQLLQLLSQSYSITSPATVGRMLSDDHGFRSLRPSFSA